jgi:hypothetical protein
MTKRKHEDPSQILLFADVVSNGIGGFNVIPRKPVMEISSRQAAQMLGVCRQSLTLIINTELGQKHLRWRWLTDKKGKRMVELESVIAYREATKDLVDQDRSDSHLAVR